ncbi:MAG: helix-turn-helix transcriptional regulator [Desulfuromonadales bacterium]|nr:helix-turn-helix transcriptional regulator [Desulfuromonadales bacterium]NIR34450.1 helix-turn-helix transcriptional regulator [Desulfuromonadales bacterium]NIS42987.1 helix-turn-helix transcriptional regulator [Desulfuromonadales bacterium]
MDESLAPTVCLDGSSVRRIREEKNFTQLYVAKVVGVTTDTISRWENNRYPTIKRSNAIRLAEALEVDLAAILRDEEHDNGGLSSALLSRRRWMLLVLLVLIGVGGAAWHFTSRGNEPVVIVRAQRLLPNYAAPGTIVPVRVRLQTEGEPTGFILRERFPKGWKLIEASPPPSSLDNVDGIARWIVKPGSQLGVIAYRIQVGAAEPAESQGKFLGEVIVDPRGSGQSRIVGGSNVVGVDYYHWADSDGDQVIADWEVLRASDTVDEMPKIHLDWDVIEDIWDAGGYRWNPEKQRFLPQRINHTEPSAQ